MNNTNIILFLKFNCVLYKKEKIPPSFQTDPRLTLGLTEPCKPAQFGHKKRELL